MRLLLIANRLPYKLSIKGEKMLVEESEGGLATGLKSLSVNFEQHWIGWPGGTDQTKDNREKIESFLKPKNIHPVFLSQRQHAGFYDGFSNKTLWPLFHYFTQFTDFNQPFEVYEEVNQLFCDKVMEVVENDDIIWIHDYHLMLLPQMLRERLPHHRIGFFLHIPFPSVELFRLLPDRKKILNGLTGANLVGFHTYEYMRHFIESTNRILGLPYETNGIDVGERIVHVDTFPMGINFDKYHDAPASPGVQKEIRNFKKEFGDRKIILSVDRLDYSKGIINRLNSFDIFLSRFPEFREKVMLFLLVVPSRDNVDNYKALKREIEHAVGYINGKHGTIGWTPVQYIYRGLEFNQISALFNLSDIALVTPLRDGMNLVAKEFVASRNQNGGVLILSEMAGAAIEMTKALFVNPYSFEEICEALYSALYMSVEEQNERIEKMQVRLKHQTIGRWAGTFIQTIEQIKQEEEESSKKNLNERKVVRITDQFSKADNALLLLDYDGTLVPFTTKPSTTLPDTELLGILIKLTNLQNVTVVIISGRDQYTLEDWLGNTGVEMIAEHGTIIKKNGKWERQVDLNDRWKAEIREILKNFSDRTPGSLIEEKQFSIVWHYRNVDPWLADLRLNQLYSALINSIGKMPLKIMRGNKVIEVRVTGVDKGTASQVWINQKDWDFILAAGDDVTDEDLFAAMPAEALTIKAGRGDTCAKMRITDWKETRALLTKLTGTKKTGKNKEVSIT